jgi:hypothetical protein
MDNNQYKHLQLNGLATLDLPHTSYLNSIVCPYLPAQYNVKDHIEEFEM